MIRTLALALALAACVEAEPTASPPTAAGATRIVSLDYCADQYVLALVEPGRILAVSPDADADFSYMRARARGVRQVRPQAEDVLALKPDLIVRSYGGGPNAAAFFARAGTPVLDVPWSEDLAGVRAGLATMAEGLGAEERGAQLIAEFDKRLSALAKKGGDLSALYVTPGGYTAGPGTLTHEMLSAAGLRNMETEPGYRPVPLERLARDAPDLVAAGFAEQRATYPDLWSAARHPVLRARMAETQTVALDGAWVACGGWFVLDAVEALAAAP